MLSITCLFLLLSYRGSNGSYKTLSKHKHIFQFDTYKTCSSQWIKKYLRQYMLDYFKIVLIFHDNIFWFSLLLFSIFVPSRHRWTDSYWHHCQTKQCTESWNQKAIQNNVRKGRFYNSLGWQPFYNLSGKYDYIQVWFFNN